MRRNEAMKAVGTAIVVGIVSLGCGKTDNKSGLQMTPIPLHPDYSATMNPFRARGEIFTVTPTPAATRQPEPVVVVATPVAREVSSSR